MSVSRLAGVAQLVEQLIRNQQVRGSSPRAGSKIPEQTSKYKTSVPSFSTAVDGTLKEMCHNVHMKTISIRELHLETGRWVRHAASRGPIVVTDRGRRVAALQPFDASVTRRSLPNREATIRKRSKVPVDSAVYQSDLREDR